MARKPRIDYKGALHHVMCRGNNGDYILKEDKDKESYLQLIKKYKERYGFKLFAYCIMDNHVHMLIERENTSLSKIMQGIQQSYTQRYNKKYNRKGHVFQQRYKAELCNKDDYLLQLIKYIHMNPVKAGFKEGLNYRWSSYRIYISGKDNDLVETEFVLGFFSKNLSRAIERYKEFMKENNNVISTEEYLINQEECLNKYEENNTKSTTLDIDELIEKVCEICEVKIEDIVKRTRIKRYSDIRKAIVLLSEEYVNISNENLANKLNISSSMVSKIRSGASKRNKEVNKIVELVKSYSLIQA
ncbi:transposase [Caldisalinibacter kiritimatiensis]|uniref:Transposase IS200-like domain-containing protein n=1 Tax=Caldisalinibacter kiritimatiensis TaxID=1304284 RepID=R1CDC9_9FIRM|nr:transposase [Caldisalinibacter kiritimatiensis]EOD00300.1 protein of unknown function DUF1568 [Caldisalinibacter kiritimatiensis]